MSDNPSQKKGNKKIMKKVDKLVMGAIIGGAIGSVVGATYKNRQSKMQNQDEVVYSEQKAPKKKSLLIRILRRLVYGKRGKK